MDKIKVALIAGGVSAERDISLSTGKEIYQALDKDKYDIILIDAAKLPGSKLKPEEKTGVKVDALDAAGKAFSVENMQPLTEVANCDVAFIALHGKYGEDGTIQGFLELMRVPYTGSGVMASAIAMNKSMTKNILSAIGLTVAKSVDVKAENGKWNKEVTQEVGKIGYPVIVKPSKQGSSVGMTKVEKEDNLAKAVDTAIKFDDEIIIEKFITGTEISVSVLGNEEPVALPIVEIVPKNGSYDYYSKYAPGATEEIIPARIGDKATKKAQEDSIKAYKALGCSGVARVDIIVSNDDIYILEVNTIPGMTPTSLLPQSAQAYGINFTVLLDKLISYALK